MDENKNQLEDDTTEGHAIKFKGAIREEGDGEGTEGHGRFTGALPDEGDDEGIEGHGGRVKF